ncbi:MAG: ATP-binding cassette domain-containing protein [Sphingobacteriia bacterium]|nr:ATP-binding cassette domain-containing protein [Sphingobacteriia bacterium]
MKLSTSSNIKLQDILSTSGIACMLGSNIAYNVISAHFSNKIKNHFSSFLRSSLFNNSPIINSKTFLGHRDLRFGCIFLLSNILLLGINNFILTFNKEKTKQRFSRFRIENLNISHNLDEKDIENCFESYITNIHSLTEIIVPIFYLASGTNINIVLFSQSDKIISVLSKLFIMISSYIIDKFTNTYDKLNKDLVSGLPNKIQVNKLIQSQEVSYFKSKLLILQKQIEKISLNSVMVKEITGVINIIISVTSNLINFLVMYKTSNDKAELVIKFLMNKINDTIDAYNKYAICDRSVISTLKDDFKVLNILKNGKIINDKNLSDELNFENSPGKLMYIEGSTGSGKTTLLNVLFNCSYANNSNSVIKLSQDMGIGYSSGNVNVSIYEWMCLKEKENELNELKERYPAIFESAITLLTSARRIVRDGKDGNIQIRYFTHNEANDILSGGEKAKLKLARALLLDYKVIILDESLEQIDFTTQKEIIKELARFAKEKGIKIIFTQHFTTDNITKFKEDCGFNFEIWNVNSFRDVESLKRMFTESQAISVNI